VDLNAYITLTYCEGIISNRKRDGLFNKFYYGNELFENKTKFSSLLHAMSQNKIQMD
jgi:hypothetical protein